MMTHNQIIAFMRRSEISKKCPGKIGDYISIAVADGWTKQKIVIELYNLYLNVTGINHWEKLSDLYDEYMASYDLSVVPDPEDPLPKRMTGKYIVKDGDSRIKPIIYRGIIYPSTVDAAKKLKVNRDRVRTLLRKGEASYV